MGGAYTCGWGLHMGGRASTHVGGAYTWVGGFEAVGNGTLIHSTELASIICTVGKAVYVHNLDSRPLSSRHCHGPRSGTKSANAIAIAT